MRSTATETGRVIGFSDAVFAVIITVLVLDLRPLEMASFAALLGLWPAAVSYAVSYLFIAIVWVNHRHVLGYADAATARLVWGNFAHLFSVSLIPFSTAWIADTRLATVPVSLYAAVFMTVNITYLLLCREIIDRRKVDEAADRARHKMRRRSLLTIVLFAAASVVALPSATVSLGLICFCLFLYLRPEMQADTAIQTAKGSEHE